MGRGGFSFVVRLSMAALCAALLPPGALAAAPQEGEETGDPLGFVVILDDGARSGDVHALAARIVEQARGALPSLRLARRVAPLDATVPVGGSEILFRRAVRGFAVRLDLADADGLPALEQHPDVDYVAVDLALELHDQQFQPGMERIRVRGNAQAQLAAAATAPAPSVPAGVDADVAILDTGIDAAHPDLNVHAAVTFVAGEPTLDDGHGHGTHVAGIVGAIDDEVGIYGVASGARLWSVKVVDQYGNGTLSDVLAGLDYVLENADEIDVVNISFGFSSLGDDDECGSTLGDALHEAICAVVDAGVVVVASAGNAEPFGQDASLVSPASFDEVITVSAVVETDGLGPSGGQGPPSIYGPDNAFAGTFSNYGWDVDIAAPGVEITSTAPGGGYVAKTGTSAAAPHVAGAAADFIATHGKPLDREGALHVRDELVRLAFPQRGPDEGFTGDKDAYAEPLLNVAAIDPVVFDPVDPRLSTDKAVYAHGSDTRAVITAAVRNAQGQPLEGLPGNAFLAYLGGRQRDVEFQELGTGRYTLGVGIGGLLPGDHDVMVRVRDVSGFERSAGCRVVIRDPAPRLRIHGYGFSWPIVSPDWALESNPLVLNLMDAKGAPVPAPSSAFQTTFSGGGPPLIWTQPPTDYITGLSPGITYGRHETFVTGVASLPLGTHVADVTVTLDGLSDSASTSFEIGARSPGLAADLAANLSRFDFTQSIPPAALELRLDVRNEWSTPVSALLFQVAEPFAVRIDGEVVDDVTFSESPPGSGSYVASDVPLAGLAHGRHRAVVRVTDSRGVQADSNPTAFDVVRATGACANPDAGAGDPDADGDGVRDACDNCPGTSNRSQRRSPSPDAAERPLGDACRPRARSWVSSDAADNADFASIQAALDAAMAAAETIRVEVLPGTGPYLESVIVDRPEPVHVAGRDLGWGRPVVEAPTSGAAVFELRAAGGATVSIDGLVLRGRGAGSGGEGVAAEPGVSTRLSRLRLEELDVGLRLGDGRHRVRRISADASVATAVQLDDGVLTLARAELRGVASALQLVGAASEAVAVNLLAVGDGAGECVRNDSLLPGALELRHATLTGCGTAVVGGDRNTTIDGSIVWGNAAGTVGVSCVDVRWSDLQSLDCGDTNLALDPLFVDEAAGDLRLQPGSPLLDHGPDPAGFDGIPCTDLDGGPRLVDHDGDGVAVADPGAYERPGSSAGPPEVTGLAWTSRDTLTWQPVAAATSYHVYRGMLGSLGYADFGTCEDGLDPARSDTTLVDPGVPLPGDGFFYEITAEDAAGLESTLGSGTCAERTHFAPCP